MYAPDKKEGTMPATPAVTGRCIPAWPKYALRIIFGVIWLIDAVLKWLPGFRSGYMSSIRGAGMGQPGWLQWWFHFWINMQNPAPTFFAYLVAVLETLVALAVILGFARKFSYIAAAVFSVVIWAAAEGFGGPYGSGSSDIGTAIIYALVFMCLLTLAATPAPTATARTTTSSRRSPGGTRSPRWATRSRSSQSRPRWSPHSGQPWRRRCRPRQDSRVPASQRPEPGRAQPERPGRTT